MQIMMMTWKCENLTFTCSFITLTLDQSTLFYWTLSDSNDKKRKHGRIVSEWASRCPSKAKPTSRASSQTIIMTCKFSSSCSNSILPIPLLTNISNSTAPPSVLAKNIRVVSRMAPASAPAKVKANLEPVEIVVYSDAGLSDHNETKGNERDAAVNSLVKEKKHITSTVSFLSYFHRYVNDIYVCVYQYRHS
jgi:hypothetical protein